MPLLLEQSFHARFCLDALGAKPVASMLFAQDGSLDWSLLIIHTICSMRGLQPVYSPCEMMLHSQGLHPKARVGCCSFAHL